MTRAPLPHEPAHTTAEHTDSPARPRRGLGRGLAQLIPTGPAGLAGVLTGPGVRELPVSWIEANPSQPRSEFDDAALKSLADSIRRYGILQPVIVEATGGEHFRLLAGERRWRAAQMAGLTRIPAAIRPQAEERETLELALVENLQRADLSPLDEARAYTRLADEFGLTQEAIATRVGRSRPAVANAMRLLQATAEVQAALATGAISAAHARALLSITDPVLQQEALRQVIAAGLSVRDTERLARAGGRAADAPARPPSAELVPPAPTDALAEALTRVLGTRVLVRARRRGRGGQILIEYFDPDQLDGLCARLGVRL
ncbi:MAG TPA: ParB/RepB/Spo0J family partition protein [Candidatus Dormibacteraeota bacterium]|nr:ParB/RepB/Spo0J family partition protein [Candidatus Dormibacteraeota bacterium]